ncbi:MAG: hypothetical protein R8G66_19760 [Cytophagales bacterium]|nr:hypothetical protein [Cytophagales bacterium]
MIIDRIDNPNLSVDDVPHKFNVRRSKTYRLIKELTKKTPKAYIKEIKLEFVHVLIKKRKIKNTLEGARAEGMMKSTEIQALI